VIDIQENRVTFTFEHAGFKTLDLAVANLQRVEGSAFATAKPDIERLERLCRGFHAKLEHNRTGYNDGGMALQILADVKRCGRPSAGSLARLLNWCHTAGSVFQSGVPLAREICIVIYGRVLPDPDIDNPSR
jgi:hypothetical protein